MNVLFQYRKYDRIRLNESFGTGVLPVFERFLEDQGFEIGYPIGWIMGYFRQISESRSQLMEEITSRADSLVKDGRQIVFVRVLFSVAPQGLFLFRFSSILSFFPRAKFRFGFVPLTNQIDDHVEGQCFVRHSWDVLHKMNLRDDISQTVSDAGIEGLSFVSLTKWEAILIQIAERFLNRGVRDLESIWLWNSFKKVVSSSQPEDPVGYLRQQIEPAEVYWFIASDENGKYWVADATGTAIVRTVEEMHGFEYYVVDRHLNWLLCENHHGIFTKALPAKNLTADVQH